MAISKSKSAGPKKLLFDNFGSKLLEVINSDNASERIRRMATAISEAILIFFNSAFGLIFVIRL